MTWRLGDIPTWVASIGTVGALGAALFQINTERRRRHQVEEQNRDERHRQQARLVSAVPGPVEQATFLTPARSGVDCLNASFEPVYNVVVSLVFIQGAGPRTTEEMLWLRLGGTSYETVPTTTLNVLSPGKHRAWIGGSNWSGILSGRVGAEIAFTDRNGAHWVRRANGELAELAVDPLKHFAEFGFVGPYDFQTPEPLD